MTVKEMHIDVSDQVQLLSGNRNRKFSTDQLDWNLNRAQTVMIESAVEPSPGSGRFQVKPGKDAYISGLLASRVSLDTGWITDRYMSLLPGDFWYLLDDGSRICQICKGELKTTQYTTLDITSVSFPFSTLTAGYYSSVELVYNNSTLINITSLLQQRQITYTGLNSRQEHFYIRELLMQRLTELGIRVYWENFYNISQPYTLLFVSIDPAVPIVLKLDGIDYTGTTQTRTLETHSGPRITTLVPNTMVSPDKQMSTAGTPYFRTSYISPTSEQGSGVLYTYVDGSFIVYNTSINYVRKPRMISLILGTDCQLSPSVHQELCNRTAQMILERIEDPGWKEMTEQNTNAKQ